MSFLVSSFWYTLSLLAIRLIIYLYICFFLPLSLELIKHQPRPLLLTSILPPIPNFPSLLLPYPFLNVVISYKQALFCFVYLEYHRL